ncbi:MAG TPA: type II CRISPR RNA-guided endonuclease Cas9, partial [Planctomycetes bacterium]|nr:type II CRISPR RNA-guided endonuclease Cas9 [Planctomycetota bacterium]
MKEPHETLLGLDLGTNSIGWALLALDEDSSPTGILASGVRVFPAGVDGDFEKGREESRNSKRRSVRLARRQIRRRSRRKKKLYNLLAKSKLLPPADTSDPIEIHKKLLHLDGQLRLSFAISHRNQQLLPYLLREKALREALTPFELGRAIYHLAQRRGFLSNRKTSPKENEDCGVVKQSIVDLDAEIKASGAPTLGAYLCSLDPDVARIRCRYISRSMITEEFEKILQQQAPFHPILRDRQFVSALREVIFYQRPLKSQRHLIGFCELEPKKRRAALSYPEVQRWRYLQTLNNLKVLFVNGDERKLSDKERSLLIEYLERKGDLSFSRVKQILGFPLRGKDAVKFNLEEGGEKRIPGNRTLSAIRNIFGDSFDTIGPKDIEKIYHDLVSIRNPSVLQRKGARVWGLSQEKAAKFADLQLENDYARLSLKAIRKILPFLEKGLTYAKALECAYPGRDSSGKEPLGLLPPVFEAIPSLRNPAVARVLTELRKIINAIIEKYGKPTMIRLELARDLKRSKKARQERWREMRAKQQAREKIIKKIQKEIGICSPSRSDVLKGLLFEECGGQCPYTGFQFGFADLYGTHPKADVEHILPFSRSLDDSFLNKTLCLARENRQRKRNRTPFEAYGGDPARWNEILHRVSKFNGDSWLRRQKLARFKTENLSSEFLNDFCSRQLNDTRYASTLARDYLGLLYGGYIDASRKTRIQTCT